MSSDDAERQARHDRLESAVLRLEEQARERLRVENARAGRPALRLIEGGDESPGGGDAA
jgi:hypothetical protein